jgi:YD repeat-containing protein
VDGRSGPRQRWVHNFSALGQINIRDLPREAFNVISRVVRQDGNCEVLAWETKHLRTIARVHATMCSNSFPGLLVSKVDARSIRTCAQYDALNRQTVVNYSNGDSTVTTTYDQSACLGLSACQNVGHATSITDAAGSESWAYQTDSTNLRSVHVNQRTTNSITKTSTYYFNLAGDLYSITYPTGRVVNYAYDAANRAQSAVDSANGITYAAAQSSPPTGCLSSGVCYTPEGTEYSAAIGKTSSFNGVNLSETYSTASSPSKSKPPPRLAALSTSLIALLTRSPPRTPATFIP